MDAALVTTPFGATSTAAEVAAGLDLSGQRIVVTGGAAGIGLETTRALVGAGAEVTMAVRNVAAGERVAAELGARVAPLDLADQGSVAAFVAGWDGPLDALVNNAGVMAIPLTRTPEGWEMQFATNHLGHFALTVGLHDALAAAGGRIVSVSSRAHLNGDVDFEDVHFERRAYDPWLGYSQSKTANVLFAVEATRRWAADGITANSLHPGRIPGTDLMRHISGPGAAPTSFQANSTAVSWKDIEQGAATSVLLAASPLVTGISGRYFEDCNEAEPQRPGVRSGVAAFALDPDAARRLWTASVEMLAVASA
jgi:NAD(P)-dependent dehydrogenase (short-subunit alcohol dehydrogenase family)